MDVHLAFVIVLLVSDVQSSSSRPLGDPISAIQGLVSRNLGPQYVGFFEYEVISDQAGSDVFEVDSDSQQKKPVLRGNNGVSLASALNFYLKYSCNCSISWGRDGTGNQLNLPHPLPLPSTKLRMVSPVKYRYYQNVCTVSYSMVWWDFARWQQEIDWMALNGLNLILSFTGQEYVWRQLYSSVGVTETELQQYFSGAAFLAWQRMGNIKGWGSPLDNEWIDNQAQLQKQILNATRQFGMINVLPGFAGHVPDAIARIYPNATLIKSAAWGNFNSTYTEVFLLQPTDPIFAALGKAFYKLLIAEFGTDHVYNCDTYNEMDPSSSDPTFLANTNAAIYEAMAAVDPDAIFLMQAWLFHSGFWTNDRIEAFLSGVPDASMLILDLNSEQEPLWQSTDSYFGKPFIWCLLHNYGGTRGIYGNLTTIAVEPLLALRASGSTMVGVGMTPEAIEHNPVVYDLMGEMSWRQDPVNVGAWVSQYAVRRYGSYSPSAQTSWQLLLQGAYIYQWSWNIKSVVDRAPDFIMELDLSFNSTSIAQAFAGLVQASLGHEVSPEVGPYRYDLVDIGRQTMVNLFYDLQTMFTLAYLKYGQTKVNSSDEILSISTAMLDLLNDLDALLGSDTNFLLGHWIADARAMATTSSLADNLEFNARNQIAMWGPNENIEDYAGKEWSGQVKDYYGGRWSLFTSSVWEAVRSGQTFDQSAYEEARFEFERAWSYAVHPYPTEPQGDTIEIAVGVYQKYFRSAAYIQERYIAKAGVDVVGGDLYGSPSQPWTRDLGQVAFLCDVNPTCVGFNSVGILKNSTQPLSSVPTMTLYLKKT